MKRNSKPQYTAIAACVATINPKAPGEMRLIPAGSFRARDGRPTEAPAWRMDAAIAASVIALAAAAIGDMVIDYEHQTLYAEKNGQAAPAAGWFKTLQWREGDGLYAVDVRWNERARAAIAAEEYRYISPVFAYARTGEVLAIQMASLTNYPALDGLEDLTARAAAKFQPTDEDNTVDKAKLIALLGLSETATDAQIDTALAALKAKAGETDGLTAQVATLKAKTETPDPGKFVSIESHKKVVDDLAALKGDLETRDLDALIGKANDDGRLPEGEIPWAREHAKLYGFAALKASLEKRPVIAALRRTQTDGKGPAAGQAGELDDTALAVCRQMGVKPEDYKKSLAA